MRVLPILLLAVALLAPAAHAQSDKDVQLYQAVADQDLARVAQLIKAGADVDVRRRPWNLTPLLLAAERDAELVRVLLEAGADVNAADREGQTVLMKAVHVGNTDAVRLLVQQKDLDLEARAGLQANTALTYAVMWGRPDIAKIIIDAGADVNVVRVNGTTPLSLARHMVKLAREMRDDGSKVEPSALDLPRASDEHADHGAHGKHAAHEHDDIAEQAPGDADADLYAHKGHDAHGHRLRTRADAIREHGLVLTLLESAGAKLSGEGDAPAHQHHH